MAPSPTVQLAQALIRRPSVTPEDAGCQELLASRLAALGFEVEHLRFGEVDNFWARRGRSGPVFAFAGHTDVVPTGPLEQWTHPPFAAVLENGMLHGRGAADMKGSLAAFLTATERFVARYPAHSGSIAWLITSDEEGPGRDGTLRVMQHLQARGEQIDWCLVGEPSSTERLGDVVKNGRRGSLGAELRVFGVQGHVAYPHLAENPIHRALPALVELSATEWDRGNSFFPATSFQISNIHSGTGATNVIPGHAEVVFNFRYSTETHAEDLKQRVEAVLDRHALTRELRWSSYGEPFLTSDGPLVEAVCQAIEQVTGERTTLATTGGTSDGRYIAPTGTHVVELGPCNATIHRIDECVRAADLDLLSAVYERILEHLVGNDSAQ